MAGNVFDQFKVLFSGSEVFLEHSAFPLGQLTTDILNLDGEILEAIDRRVNDLMPAVQTLFEEKTDSAARSAQERLNAVWDLIFELPVYRDLSLDVEASRTLFPSLLANQVKWVEVLDVNSEGRQMFAALFSALNCFSDGLRNFRGQLGGMLELYFEPLPRRSSETYAEAYASYFREMSVAGRLFFPEQEFHQSVPVELCYVPAVHPTKAGSVILAEKVEFSRLVHFLYADFYRGLMAGNVPRRCHNCGRYFLLTAGYNTCYCNHVAPGETERTCRKVGAHRKANHPTGLSPAGVEYRRTYNRLRARKQRGKISREEWNAAVAKAQELVTQSERGELSDEELKGLLEEL